MFFPAWHRAFSTASMPSLSCDCCLTASCAAAAAAAGQGDGSAHVLAGCGALLGGAGGGGPMDGLAVPRQRSPQPGACYCQRLFGDLVTTC